MDLPKLVAPAIAWSSKDLSNVHNGGIAKSPNLSQKRKRAETIGLALLNDREASNEANMDDGPAAAARPDRKELKAEDVYTVVNTVKTPEGTMATRIMRLYFDLDAANTGVLWWSFNKDLQNIKVQEEPKNNGLVHVSLNSIADNGEPREWHAYVVKTRVEVPRTSDEQVIVYIPFLDPFGDILVF